MAKTNPTIGGASGFGTPASPPAGAPATGTTTAPAAATTAEAAAPEKEKVKKGVNAVEYWDTPEKAVEIASGRNKGAYRAFQVQKDGKVLANITANHVHFVSTEYLTSKLGYTINEIGKEAHTRSGPKAIGLDAIKAAIGNLPEAERAAIMAQLAALNAPKK